ncbi:MAG: hypothetical protein LBK98_06620 [Peptococcaceae bacterium]|jgi:nitrogen regulatory protein PII|nr:hypothetical protein [Peptococcaceae bacterium]
MTEQGLRCLPRQLIRIVVAIVDRGKGKRVVDIFLKHHVHLHFLCLGLGTATSETLDYFGLGETDKDVVITLTRMLKVPELLAAIGSEMQMKRPGKGIIFSLPISGISGLISQTLLQEEGSDCDMEMESEVSKMNEHVKHDLILTILNEGHKDEVMTAARAAGASGGTVILAHSVGLEDTERFLGINIQPEKEIVVIIAHREQKAEIMKAISQVAGLHTAGRGIIFSLPVDSLSGME